MRVYNSLTTDSSRIKNRIKAVYRGRGISCSGDKIYNKDHRDEWIACLDHEGLRYRVSTLFKELDGISTLRTSAENMTSKREDLLEIHEKHRHEA